MKKRYGIGFFAGTFVMVLLLSVAYQLSYNKAMKDFQAEQELLEQAELKEEEQDVISTDGDAHRAAEYYLKNLNGYVVVYLSDTTTVYEYTNIAVTDLPDTVKKEVLEGKFIESDVALYGFLENYSS